MNYDRWEVFGRRGEKPSTWLWCGHCERCYQLKDMRVKGGLQMCHYADCSGDTVMDARRWSELREMHPEYPKEPETGKVYGLYGGSA